MFVCAKEHGLAVKLHSDQFHSIGGVELGVRVGALSVDHLEAAGDAQIAAIAASEDDRYDSARGVAAFGYSCGPGAAAD